MRYRDLALCWAFASICSTASAQTGEVQQYSVERFRLSLDRNGLFDTEWAEVTPHLAVHAGLWLGYADDPLVIKNGAGVEVGQLVAERMGGSLLASVGLFEWVELGIGLPIVLYQDRPRTAPGVGGELGDLGGGVGDLSLLPKVRILRQKDQGLGLVLIPAISFPTSREDGYLGERVVTFRPELAASRAFGAFRVAANLGYTLRRNVSFANIQVDNEFLARIGLGYRFADSGGPPLEIDVGLATTISGKKPFERSDQTYLELIGGLVYDATRWLACFAGAGAGLNDGVGTPDYRVLGGVRLSFEDRDQDDDGLEDEVDACDEVKEDFDGFEDADGCPEEDNDRDSILDPNDLKPNEPEDRDGFEDADGAPDPDNDADGVLDPHDLCPLVAGLEKLQGCPDSDGDGLTDASDGCPKEPEDVDAFRDDDGCPDGDNDSDGVLDEADGCPLQPGVVENRGCPDPDRDGDTVVDRLDNCPDEPGDPKNKGCKRRQLVVITRERLEILDKVYFDTGSARIQPRSFPLLKNVAAVLKSHPEILKIRVEGHTDSQGSDEMNKKLSQKRADALVSFLVKEGVEAGRMVATGFGEERPVASNDTAEGRAENRRVEFNILQNAQDAGARTMDLPEE